MDCQDSAFLRMASSRCARVVALLVGAASPDCGGKTSSGNIWIWESTDCIDPCAIASPANFLETLWFEGDHATLFERADGCSLTVSEIPVMQKSEGMEFDAAMGHLECSPDPCVGMYTVNIQPNPSSCSYQRPQAVDTLVCPSTRPLLNGLARPTSNDTLTITTVLGGFCFVTFRHAD
jgi:hypothetical protein